MFFLKLLKWQAFVLRLINFEEIFRACAKVKLSLLALFLLFGLFRLFVEGDNFFFFLLLFFFWIFLLNFYWWINLDIELMEECYRVQRHNFDSLLERFEGCIQVLDS